MVTRRTLITSASAAVLAAFALSSAPALAETAWPEKPVRILVSFPPGGASDLVGRLLAQHLSDSLGEQFVVENKPGAAGTLAAGELQSSAADGYTLMLSNLTPFNVAPTRFPDTPYDPIADFTHVTYIGSVHLGLFVRPEVGAADLGAFVDLAKSEPGTLDYGSSGVGSWGHVVAERFKALAGVDIVHIPYKGSGPMRLDFRSGVVPVIFDAVPQNLPSVEEGAAVPLAVTAPSRIPTLPDTPTFTELGLDIVAENWLGVSAPAGLDPEIAAKLDAALQDAMAEPEVVEQFATWGLVREPKTSEEFSAYVAGLAEAWKPLVEAAMPK